MKSITVLAVASIVLSLCGCVVNDDPEVVTVPGGPTKVITTPSDRPDVNIDLKQQDIEIKRDPPYKSTTGY